MKKSLLAEKATFSSPITVQPITMDLASKKAHPKKKIRSRTGQRIPRSIPTKIKHAMDSDKKEKKKNKQIITEKMEINRLNSTKTNLPGKYIPTSTPSIAFWY